MELNALTRWESIGLDLYKRGQLGDELDRLAKYSKYNTAVNKKKQFSRTQEQLNEEIADEIEQATVDEGARDVYIKHVIYLYCTLRRFFKGFSVGYGGKSIFAILSTIIKTKGKPGKLWSGVKAALTSSDSISYGLFLGGFLTAFEQIMRSTHTGKINAQNNNNNAETGSISNVNGSAENGSSSDSQPNPLPEFLSKLLGQNPNKKLSRTLRVFLASAVASLAFLFLPNYSKLGISMFFFVRALEILGKLGCERGILPRINHGDTLLMAVASAQVIWGWLFFRDSVEPSYLHFLDYQGGRYFYVQRAFAVVGQSGSQFLSQQAKLMQELNSWRVKNNFSPIILPEKPQEGYNFPSARHLACEILHPQTKFCTKDFIEFFRAAYLRALPVYTPVYILPLLLFRLKSLIKSPITNSVATALGVLRSSLFLASYCSIAWATACCVNNIAHHSTASGFIAGFVAGLTVAIEKKGRRIELALYVLSQAIPSFTRTMQYYSIFPRIKHAEFAVFMLSMSIIMHAYVIKPHLLRRSYLSLLTFFFGSGLNVIKKDKTNNLPASTPNHSVQLLQHNEE
jgi:hypothetical protein